MADFNFNGVKLTLDIMDADVADKYEAELQKVIDIAEHSENLKFSESIRKQCKAVFDFLDAMFGEGTHNKVFGESVNLRICLDVFKTITETVTKEINAPVIEKVPPKNKRGSSKH